MTKKILVTLSIMIFLLPNMVSAQFNYGRVEIGTAVNFLTWKNEYRVDFGMPPLALWDTMETYFESDLGQPFTKSYTYSEISSRIMMLTCNGTYQFIYYKGAEQVYWSDLIVTTQINNPPCQSYPDSGAANDLNAGADELPGGDYRLHWDDIPGASEYEVWVDGQLVDTIPATGAPYSYDTPGGAVDIVARDANGDIIGSSNLQVPDYDGFEQPGGCDVCDKLAATLACPHWSTYMGELQNMITNALDQYFGDVPNVPTAGDIANEILPDVPDFEAEYPEGEIMPVIPSFFDNPIDFDITTGAVIPVVDDSEPFEIYEPGEFLESDDPGVFVYPGDSRNHSDGIKNPDTIATPYPEPVPTVEPGEPPGEDIPHSDMPIPTTPPGGLPMPDVPPSDIPIPTIYE